MQLFPFTSSCKSPNSFTQQRAPLTSCISLLQNFTFLIYGHVKGVKHPSSPKSQIQRFSSLFIFWAKEVTFVLDQCLSEILCILVSLFWISDKSCNPSSEYDHLSPKFKIGIGIESGQALKKCITSRQNARKPSKKHKHTKTFSKMMIHDVVTYIHK